MKKERQKPDKPKQNMKLSFPLRGPICETGTGVARPRRLSSRMSPTSLVGVGGNRPVALLTLLLGTCAALPTREPLFLFSKPKPCKEGEECDCGWVNTWPCPGNPLLFPGQQHAKDDGSLSFKYCCGSAALRPSADEEVAGQQPLTQSRTLWHGLDEGADQSAPSLDLRGLFGRGKKTCKGGCEWTKAYACPGSAKAGSKGFAKDDGSACFKKCCATPSVPGADSDEHGCKASAGYTWCASKGTCLRSFEEPCPDITTGAASTLPAAAKCGSGICTYEYDPVCAGGKTYANPCVAKASCVLDWTMGECPMATTLPSTSPTSAGGWSDMISTERAEELAKLGLSQLQTSVCPASEATGCKSLMGATFEGLRSAESQVVAGTNMELVAKTSAGDLTMKFFEQPWTNTLDMTAASLSEELITEPVPLGLSTFEALVEQAKAKRRITRSSSLGIGLIAVPFVALALIAVRFAPSSPRPIAKEAVASEMI